MSGWDKQIDSKGNTLADMLCDLLSDLIEELKKLNQSCKETVIKDE